MDDVIYRQDAIDALTTECSWTIYDEHGQLTPNGEDILGTLKKIPSAQPEQAKYVPDTKAIPSSRDCVDLSERVTATFYDVEHEEWSQKTVTIQDVLDSVCDEYTVLPSAQKKGHWIFKREEHSTYTVEQAVCSECGEPCATYGLDKPRDRFCKWCGADMRGDENG